MADIASSVGNTFPAGGSYMVSPADVGTPTRPYRGGQVTGDLDAAHHPMEDWEVQSAMHLMVTDAVQYVDQELSPARGLAADYYLGKPFGNEEEGRSQVVMTVLRDTVKRILPSLLRVFFGGEKGVEYAPRRVNQLVAAEQMTEYISEVVIRADNNGFNVFYGWFKDALIKRLGVIKFWTDESEESRFYRLSNLSEQQVLTLENDPEVTQLDSEPNAEGLFDVEFVRVRSAKRLRLIGLPPEEYLFTRGARTTRDDATQPGVAPFVAHRTQLTKSQLLAAGVPEEVIAEWAFTDMSLEHNVEEISRQNIVKPMVTDVGPDATRRSLYIEAYPYLDADGDGIAELRRVIMLGPTYKVISDEPWDHRPFAVLCPDPEPHTIIGQGINDYTMDLQKIGSMVLRAILDSLALSLNPRVAYVEGEVSLEDILNNEIGAPIRESQPGMVEPFEHPFVGQQALPVLEKLEDILENRVGVSKDTAGLNPQALQSSTAIAVASAVTAAQMHVEMIARVFAETGVTELYTGLLREAQKHPDPTRVIRLRGNYVEMDPRVWDSDLDVRVNVAIGAGLDAEKLDVMVGAIQKQEEIMKNLGPSNPAVDLATYINSLKKVMKFRGRMDADEWFKDVPPGWAPPQPQGVNPVDQAKAQAETMRAQADVQKTQAQTQHAQQRVQIEGQRKQAETQLEGARVQIDAHATQADISLDQQKLQLEHEREKDRMREEIRLKEMEMNAKLEIERIRESHEHEARLIEARNSGKKDEKEE